MAVDDSSLLPKAPPPRPARRDAAIKAALRRFDGVEEPEVTMVPQPRWGFGGRPQFGALVTASLIAVIGLPAALIAIRNSEVSPPGPDSPTSARRESAAGDTVAVSPGGATEPGDFPRPPPARASASPPSPHRRHSHSDESELGAQPPSPVAANEPSARALAAPPASALAPALAPPPPPSAAERDETYSQDGQIVVTGSTILRTEPFSEGIRDGRGRSRSAGQKSNAPTTAPKWVLENGAYRRFLGQLQAAVRRNDRPAVVKLVRLPLRVNFPGDPTTYRDSRSVLADYDRIFTPRVKQAIADQRFENLFGRDQGVMIGDGAVWFDHACRSTSCSPPGPVRISAINP